MSKSLALKYRPQVWADVVEQDSVKAILQNQLNTGDIKQAYLFVGAAGTGKTTCARIFAKEINNFKGLPIELDAASNNSVDDVRSLNKMAQTRSVDGEYKVFILDEVHMFSAGAWAAMLKLIEEPPAKTIFILCTTDYWKIPKTILSRCQRYEFKRISTEGIHSRLSGICDAENILADTNALDFIARQSDGCLRDAITNLDKCVAFSDTLAVGNVTKALGLPNFDVFYDLTFDLIEKNKVGIINILEDAYSDGQDMKQFVKAYLSYVLDIVKFSLTKDIKKTSLPTDRAVKEILEKYSEKDILSIFDTLLQLDTEIKWSTQPKNVIEARLLTYDRTN